MVIEAQGLEPKDANGYSDPYCMLGICLKSLEASNEEESCIPTSVDANEKLTSNGRRKRYSSLKSPTTYVTRLPCHLQHLLLHGGSFQGICQQKAGH